MISRDAHADSDCRSPSARPGRRIPIFSRCGSARSRLTKDYAATRDWLAEAAREARVEVWAWRLMPNPST